MYTRDNNFIYGKKSMFIDEYVYDAVEAFDKQNSSVGFLDDCSKQNNSKRFAVTLSKFFRNIMLNGISLSFVLDVLASTYITNVESRDITRFLIFLLENEYIHDNTLFRLTIFRGNEDNKENKKSFVDAISKLNTSKIIRILTCENFQEYIDMGTILTIDKYGYKIGTQLFLIELPDKSSIDSELCEFLSNYFEGIKLNTTLDVHTRLAQARAFADSVIFFRNIAIKDITSEFLYNAVKSNEEIMTSRKGRTTVNQLYKVVLSMVSRGLIKDSNLCHLANLDLHNGFSTETLLNILGKPNINKYTQVPYPGMTNKNSLFYINIQSNEVRKVFIEFLLTTTCRTGLVRICEEFDISLGNYSIERIEDLNLDSYRTQLLYFNKYDVNENGELEKRYTHTSSITAFYMYIKQNYNRRIFEGAGIDSNIIQRIRIAQEILDGYKAITYNPHEEVPNADKWLLCYMGFETNNYTELNSITSSSIVDFTQIKSETYRNFCKHFVWYYDQGVNGKIMKLNILITFCNYISDLKSGKIRYLGVTPTKDEEITMNEVVAFKYYTMDTQKNNFTISAYLGAVRVFLKYISDHNFIKMGKGVFWHLKNIPRSDKGTANAIVDEDLNKVSEFMKKKAKESTFNNLCFNILYIAIHTPFRSSHIVTWKVGAIKDTVREGQFRTYSRTKTTHGQEVPIPITLRTKRIIDKSIKITEPYRQECKNEKIKNFVFIVQGKKRGTYSNLTPKAFNNYFKICCKEVGVSPQYTLANLRDTRMSKAEVEVAKKGYSDMEQNVLVQHKNPNSINSYSDIDIRECLEAVYQVYIGNVDIKGKIVKIIPQNIATDEKSVSEGCGYCGTETCDNYSYLDCVMCKHFRTSPEQIPFFKEQIKICNKKIVEAKINHDKEDFQAIKRLMVTYLEKLILIQKEDINE